ncbi:MAG: DUF5947 family protein [Tepidisphaeraceae bacterium]
MRPKPPGERCELCSAGLGPEHAHLVEPATRRMLCSCDACAVLFDGRADGRFRRVPRDTFLLPDFQMSEAQWEGLHLPINLALFFHSTPAQKMVALYPSPAGPVESLLSLDSWQELLVANPALATIQPDVQALLVNRIGKTRGFDQPEYYLAPIDQCYALVGVVRAHWRGLSGGNEAWQEIRSFFERLRARSRPIYKKSEEQTHA